MSASSTRAASPSGVSEGDSVQPLRGDLFSGPRPAGRPLPLAAVRLLYPCVPRKVLAVGRNYQSHLGSAAAAQPA